MNALWNTAWVTALAAGMAGVAGAVAVVTWLGLGRRGRLLGQGGRREHRGGQAGEKSLLHRMSPSSSCP